MDTSLGFREFGVIHDESAPKSASSGLSTGAGDQNDVISSIRSDIMGSYAPFDTPFGKKPIIYSDWTASGRCLSKIESYMKENVLTLYGNTHTTTSITGHQSTCFRHESRQIIAEATNAKITGRASEDVVLFTGNGTTSAVAKLVSALGLQMPFHGNSIVTSDGSEDDSFRPVVFVSSYEHHSNLLPWRESVADVVTIAYDPSTGVSLTDLSNNLQKFKNRKLKIGSFSAASNVTGVLTAADQVSIIMHRAQGLVFFDYATAAPYVRMDMNPVIPNISDGTLAYKDAIFFSGHKFIGGPGCPGVLIAKKHLFPGNDEQPTMPGGGTVFYVTSDHHRYLSNREEREEGGTPNLLSDVKMGLVMHVRQSIGISWIESKEMAISRVVQQKLVHPKISLLGRQYLTSDSSFNNHLPVFSFLIKCGDRFLHHNFVCALLNDLFGIQTRGGCACAGPFSQQLLGLDAKANLQLERALLEKNEVYRPGFTRLSFPYWISDSEIDFVVKSVHFIADNGWKFLPLYRYNHKTGEWAHSTRLTRFPERKWISNFSYLKKSDSSALTKVEDGAADVCSLEQRLQAWGVSSIDELCHSILVDVEKDLRRVESTTTFAYNGQNTNINDELRWFLLSDDSNTTVNSNNSTIKGPIHPAVDFFDTNSASTSDGSHMDVSSSSDPSVSPPSHQLSAYLAKRDKKLRARVGGDDSWLPRYVKLMLDRSTDAEIDTLTKRDSKANGITSANVSNNTSNSQNGVNNKDGASASTAKSEPSNHEGDMTTFEVCTDNSCFKPRSEVAPEILNAAKSGGAFVSKEPSIMDNSDVIGLSSSSLSSNDYTYLPENKAYQLNPGMSQTLYLPQTAVVHKKVIQAPKKLLKQVGEAIRDWSMIEEGDRLLLGLSGGKDSLCLLHILLQLQKKAPVKFEIACATVDPQTESYNPSALIPYLKELGVTYHYLSEPIVELAKSKLQGDSLCAFCSRFKRGLLYACCRNFKYNKLVLGQHLDDLAESFMMSTLHNGQVRTMKANYTIEAGDVNVIRPLIYTRETQTRDFSRSYKLPIINENCPACFEQPKERARIKKLLMQEESMVPSLFFNLRRALVPLMHNDVYTLFADIATKIEEGRSAQPHPGGRNNNSNNSNNSDNSSGNKVSEKNSKAEGKKSDGSRSFIGSSMKSAAANSIESSLGTKAFESTSTVALEDAPLQKKPRSEESVVDGSGGVVVEGASWTAAAMASGLATDHDAGDGGVDASKAKQPQAGGCENGICFEIF